MAERIDAAHLRAMQPAAEVREQRELQRVTQEFESLLLLEILKSMRASQAVLRDDEDDAAGSGLQRELMDEQLARALARGDGLGLARMIEQQLARKNGGDAKP